MKRILLLITAGSCVALACRQAGPDAKGMNMNAMPASEKARERIAIGWMKWGPEAFSRARAQDNLILVDSGDARWHVPHIRYGVANAAAALSNCMARRMWTGQRPGREISDTR